MHVLICDDDSASRFVVKRLLEENFGCAVRECSDGVEALNLLGSEKFAFVMLDVDTPSMDGLATLEEIRESPATKNLPVVIMSRERHESVVLNFMRLGIADYVLKPARANTLVPKIERLMRMLPPEVVNHSNLQSIRLGAETPAMLVDGNPDFRFFFSSQMERYGPILQAASGAAALAAFHRSAVSLVFIGAELGVVTADRLARKLRDISSRPVRLVRVAGAGDPPSEPDLFDGQISRSYVPDALRAAMRPYVDVPGPLAAALILLPDLPDIIASATTHVFGMMFESDITVSDESAPLDVAFQASIEMELEKRFVVTMGVHLTKQAAVGATAKMVGMPEAEIGDADCLSVAGELVNMINGRMQARFHERRLTCACSLPTTTVETAVAVPEESHGLLRRYTIDGTRGDFIVSVLVEDRLEQVKAQVQDAHAVEHSAPA